MKKIVILISGRGSNMEALLAAREAGNLPVEVAAVISNRPDADGLETAARYGIVTHYIDHKAFKGARPLTIAWRSASTNLRRISSCSPVSCASSPTTLCGITKVA
jgi:folate-dependent phosphoribosylglycinamide formyltransferase PurN